MHTCQVPKTLMQVIDWKPFFAGYSVGYQICGKNCLFSFILFNKNTSFNFHVWNVYEGNVEINLCRGYNAGHMIVKRGNKCQYRSNLKGIDRAQLRYIDICCAKQKIRTYGEFEFWTDGLWKWGITLSILFGIWNEAIEHNCTIRHHIYVKFERNLNSSLGVLVDTIFEMMVRQGY